MSSADKAGNELDEGYFDPQEVLTEDDIRAIFSHIYSSRSKKQLPINLPFMQFCKCG